MKPRKSILVRSVLSALLTLGVAGLVYGAQQNLPFALLHSDLKVDWGVTKTQEQGCGGPAIAGGSTVGEAEFTHLGRSTLEVSAAWDIGHLITDPQFHPVGPAGGPVAPVLGQQDYPYVFHFDPRIGDCGSGTSATGQLGITAANGDMISGQVTGGETFRLDFNMPGDGVETFLIIEVTGGTGRFAGASGSFVAHTISRFDTGSGAFVIDLAELLPGGAISY